MNHGLHHIVSGAGTALIESHLAVLKKSQMMNMAEHVLTLCTLIIRGLSRKVSSVLIDEKARRKKLNISHVTILAHMVTIETKAQGLEEQKLRKDKCLKLRITTHNTLLHNRVSSFIKQTYIKVTPTQTCPLWTLRLVFNTDRPWQVFHPLLSELVSPSPCPFCFPRAWRECPRLHSPVKKQRIQTQRN